MKISVCLIVKNEQESLSNCLECVKSFADEIVIVDTGSLDNTKKIALKYTSKVFDFKWVNDFSLARNYAFSKATCDYLMWLDADDIILPFDQEKILKIKQEKTPADTYMFKYVTSKESNGYYEFYFYRERLFKNCKLAKFNGFIHEYVVPFGKINYENICITHNQRKNRDPYRNISIYNENIKNGAKLNIRDEYYLAKEYFYVGEYQKSLNMLKQLINEKSMYSADLYDCFITAYKCEQFIEKGDAHYLFCALEKFEPTSELLCLLGLYYENKKQINKAIIYYKMAVCGATNNNKIGFKNSYYDQLFPLLKLVFLLYNQGKIDQSYKIHQLLKQKFPNCEEVIFNENFFNKVNF